jgi:hypothetical protein
MSMSMSDINLRGDSLFDRNGKKWIIASTPSLNNEMVLIPFEPMEGFRQQHSTIDFSLEKDIIDDETKQIL